jgi:hypothetical protein
VILVLMARMVKLAVKAQLALLEQRGNRVKMELLEKGVYLDNRDLKEKLVKRV